MTTLLDHTTDTAIRAEGFTLRELFSNALYQMNEILLPSHCEGATHYDCQMIIHFGDPGPTALMIDFLSEALALTYIQKAVFCYVQFERLTERELTARLSGRWFSRLENEIKAVTFHKARVLHGDDGKWQSRIHFEL